MSSVKYNGVSSNSVTVDATKFVGPHKSCMRQYTTQCLLQHGTTDVVLNRHRRGLPPWSSESDIRSLSSFPSSISHFLLIAPPGLTISHLPFTNINHIEPSSWEGVYREWVSTTRLLPMAYNTNHSHSNVLNHRRVNKVIMYGSAIMQLVPIKLLYVNAQSYHKINIIK
jgi:hypothetical protein